jgi:hypothetical protein
MCTVSWLHTDDGYHLLSNRDEKRTRSLALPPSVEERRGVQFIAPIDGDFGGTWISVNERGVSICLVNGRAVDAQHPRTVSRGLLAVQVVDSRSTEEVLDRLRSADLSNVAPFQAVALQVDSPTVLVGWDGATRSETHRADAFMPLISSSFDPEGVEVQRRQMFTDSCATDIQALERIHASHGVRPDAYSICMHRPDAHTVSFSRVAVTPGTVQFSYKPAAPCKSVPSVRLSLSRRR